MLRKTLSTNFKFRLYKKTSSLESIFINVISIFFLIFYFENYFTTFTCRYQNFCLENYFVNFCERKIGTEMKQNRLSQTTFSCLLIAECLPKWFFISLFSSVDSANIVVPFLKFFFYKCASRRHLLSNWVKIFFSSIFNRFLLTDYRKLSQKLATIEMFHKIILINKS